jgi:curved DNA-binding protein CbpA
MTQPDPYALLGIPRSASDKEIKSAFRKKALLLHPDHHHGSSEAVKKEAAAAFRALNEAYQAIAKGRRAHTSNDSTSRSGFRKGGGESTPNYGSNYGSKGAQRSYQRASQSHFRLHVRAFWASGSAALTAVIAGVGIAGILVLDPLLEAAWKNHNKGKLFDPNQHTHKTQSAVQ